MSGHELTLMPQTIVDGWQALCSCGQWSAFASFYEFPDKGALLAALRDKHDAHVKEVG